MLVCTFLSVEQNRLQIVSFLILMSLADCSFSRLMPAFLTGSIASFLTIGTYFSSLGQIPAVIREKEPKYINMPLVVCSTVNAFLWTLYGLIVHDVPFLTSQILAFTFMSTNLVFYLWAADYIPTHYIQSLITVFQIAFPEYEKEA